MDSHLRHILTIAMLSITCFAGSVAVGQTQASSLTAILEDAMRDSWFQSRTQQRVIIRFPSSTTSNTANSASRVNSSNSAIILNGATKFKEEKIGKCLIINRLIASRPDGKDRLEFMTRDQQRIRAYLGDGCLAREFYAGAYVEKSEDGKLCVDRDILHARTGAKCEIEKFRLMVAQKSR
jgi:hypothetical protein